jgi:hypothetical protein
MDAEQDMDVISEVLHTGLHMDFGRHIVSVLRIGKPDENKPRPDFNKIWMAGGKYCLEQRISKRSKITKYAHFT